jgi:hypothetical protein
VEGKLNVMGRKRKCLRTQKSSTSDAFASAKVSDGASSLRKTSGNMTMSTRADLTERGKSSMCCASTDSDIILVMRAPAVV